MDTVRKAGNTEYILRRNRGQKNLRLHIGSSGEVIVSAPYFASFSEIDGFVINSGPWIAEHVSKVSQHTYATGDFVPYLGRKMSLMVIRGTARYDIVDDKIIVSVPKENIESVKKVIRRMYTETVSDILSDRVPFWCSATGSPVPEFGVNRAKGKWGVCYPSEKRLYLSYMCATLPPQLIDMTVLHEVCHLRYSGHGKAFWNLMKRNMPDLEKRKAGLAELARSGWNLNIV